MHLPHLRKRSLLPGERGRAVLAAVVMSLAAVSGFGILAISHQQTALSREAAYDPSWAAERVEAGWLRLQAVLNQQNGHLTGSRALSAWLSAQMSRDEVGILVTNPGGFVTEKQMKAARQLEDVLRRYPGGPQEIRDGAAFSAELASLTPVVTRLAAEQHEAHIRRLTQTLVALSRSYWLSAGATGGAVLCGVLLVAALASSNRRLRESERDRRETQEKMSLALTAAEAGWWSLSQDGFVTLSDAACSICGLAPGGRVSLGEWLSHVVPEDREDISSVLGQAYDVRQPVRTVRFRVAHPEKGVRTVAATFRLLAGTAARSTVAHGILLDDTDRHRLEDELRVSKEVAERAVAAKSRMLAAASHDLRQPLQSMFLFVGALECETESALREKLFVQLRTGMTSLSSMLDGLVDAARLESGKVEPRPEDFSLSVILEELDAYYSPRAAEKGISLRAVPTRLAVRSDPTLLGRMLRNLMENALRYTDRGEIALYAEPHEGWVEISVQDTGPGIAESQQKAVWEEFTRGDAADAVPKGLGLGLSIVRSLGNALGHPVGMVSARNTGSRFWIRVPAGIAPRAVGHEEEDRSTPPSPLVVVVIDDDSMVLFGLDAMLTSFGHRVIAASSSAEAAAELSAASLQPGCIITDYALAWETGPEAVEALRRTCGRRVPAIILTGEPADGAGEDELDGIPVMRKPVSPELLARALGQVTGGLADAG